MPAAYPVAADLQNYLAATGLITLPLAGNDLLLDFTNALQAAIDEFERRTARYRSASGTAVARSFDPPPGPLGILIPGSPFTGVTSVTYQGAALVATTDYVLYPLEAPQDGEPYQWVQFLRTWNAPVLWGDRAKIVITAVWGAGTVIPSAVWMAVLAGAADELFTQIIAGATGGGRRSWTQAQTTETFDPSIIAKHQEGWRGRFERAVKLYRRRAVV